MARFLNKVAIITGSSNGIGQSTAVLMASEGASVTIHGRSLDGLQRTASLIVDKGIPAERVLSIQGEIQNDQTIQDLTKKTIEKFGKIDILVNNAGVVALPNNDSESMEAYDHIHDVNIKSIIKLNNLTLPYLEQTKGNIVHVSSVSAVLPRPSRTYYSMSKAALDHYMRNKTDELARKGIRINNVNPGMVRTNILNAMGIPEEKQQSFYDHYQKSIPLGRPAESEEIAKTIAFLASSDASYITGVALLADGGNAQLATV